MWGAATASAQIEGAYNEDGKGLSIWDDFSIGHISNNENCQVACDHYHRYKEDVALMKKIGLNSYRFSISWARIFPDSSGTINKKGLNFYINLVDELIKNDIEPFVTLFHWDLPMWLYNDGGFLSSKFIDKFLEYVKVIVDYLSDKVKYWFTFNEPQSIVYGGFVNKYLAPFEHATNDELDKISRNIMLAHGMSVKYIRENAKIKPQIGFAPCACFFGPKNNSEEELKNAYEKTISSKNGVDSAGWWADPMVLGLIPENMKFLTEDDIKIINQPLDFYAASIYCPMNAVDYYKQGKYKNSLGWTITDDYMYYSLKFFSKRYNLPLLVCENGISENDLISSDGKVHDVSRVEYLQSALKQLKKAVSEGVKVIGYFHWSLLDNFEWSAGYSPRFGLIYVDYENENRRILKDSALLYKKIIESNGDDIEYKYNFIL